MSSRRTACAEDCGAKRVITFAVDRSRRLLPMFRFVNSQLQDEGDGITYLKIEPLHASSVVFETGRTDPTRASSPVPMPSRFEANRIVL